MTSFTLNFVDNSDEPTSFGLVGADIDAANHDVQIAAISTLQADVEALSLGVITSKSITHSIVQYPYAVPADVWANRETAVRFKMQGTVEPSNTVTVTLGSPDLSKFPFVALGSDIANVPFTGLHADLSSLIVEMENYARHPQSGETMTVVRMEKIGRNL